MKLSSKIALPKFLTEPVKLTDASKLGSKAIGIFSKPITIDPDHFKDLLKRPIPPKAGLFLPIALWLAWSSLIELISKHIPVITYYNDGLLKPLVTIAAALCIIILVAPFIPSNRVSVELGLSRPASLEDLD